MGEEEPRADLFRQAAQVRVRPGRVDVAIQPRFRPSVIPGQPESVAIGGGFGLGGNLRLRFARWRGWTFATVAEELRRLLAAGDAVPAVTVVLVTVVACPIAFTIGRGGATR